MDLNTASPSLLERISGLSAAVSKNIVKYREENGAFTSRNELKRSTSWGQRHSSSAPVSAGAGKQNVLDNTGVHPESYGAAKELLKLCGFGEDDVKNGSLSGLADKVAALGEESVAQQIGVGVPTLQDIVKELLKPGRDPRDELPPPLLRTDILELKDLKPGMDLPARYAT